MGPAGGRGTDFGRPMEGQSRPPQFGGPSMRPVRPQWPSEIPRQGPMDGNVFPAGPTGGAWGNLQGPGGPPANPGQGGIWDRLSPQGADKIIPRAIQGPPPRSPPRRPKGGDRNPRPGGPRPGGRSPGGPSGGMRPDVINPDIMVTQKFFPIIKGENIFYLPDGGAGLPPPPPQVPNAPQAMGYGYPYSRVQPYLKLIYNPSNPVIQNRDSKLFVFGEIFDPFDGCACSSAANHLLRIWHHNPFAAILKILMRKEK
ncbi:proline-rich protein 2-like [Arapaima gigas]